MDYMFRWLGVEVRASEDAPVGRGRRRARRRADEIERVGEVVAAAPAGRAVDANGATATRNGNGNGHKNGNGNGNGHNGNGNYSFIARTDAPTCPECGSIMIPNGSCHKCVNCGTTSGCS